MRRPRQRETERERARERQRRLHRLHPLRVYQERLDTPQEMTLTFNAANGAEKASVALLRRDRERDRAGERESPLRRVASSCPAPQLMERTQIKTRSVSGTEAWRLLLWPLWSWQRFGLGLVPIAASAD